MRGHNPYGWRRGTASDDVGGVRKSRVLLAAALVLVLGTGWWAWSRGLNGPYLFDDHVTPLGDPASQSLAAWTEHVAVTLRPLTKLTYALEAETPFGDVPAARRVVSVLLHSVSAALLLLLVRRLAPGATLITAVTLAALWFVHPVHADSVLLASGRTAVLSGLLVMGALLALHGSRRWLTALLFSLACLSRETAFAALLPLAALATVRYRGKWRVALRELTPLVAAIAIVAAWMLTTPRYLQLAEYSMLGRPLVASAIGQIGAVPVGLGLLSNPAALSIDYGISLPRTATEPLFLLGVLLYLGAAAGICLAVRRGSQAAAVGLALWLAALLPTQSVVPKLDALANRPLSLALAGLLLAAVPLVGAVSRSRPSLAFCAAATLVVSLALATSHRAALFRSELRLWHDAAAKSRVNERPYVQYAVLLKDAGREREALDALATAATINPFSSQVATLTRVYRRKEVLP
jgi:hypothetical protein